MSSKKKNTKKQHKNGHTKHSHSHSAKDTHTKKHATTHTTKHKNTKDTHTKKDHIKAKKPIHPSHEHAPHTHYKKTNTSLSTQLLKPLAVVTSSKALTTMAAFFMVFGLFSYMRFSNYAPKTITQVSEVKGSSIKDESIEIPFPVNSEIISKDLSSEQQNVTLKSSEPIDRLVEFYINALESKDWQLEKFDEDLDEGFAQIAYKKGNERVSISFTPEVNEGANATSDNTSQTSTIVVLDLDG